MYGAEDSSDFSVSANPPVLYGFDTVYVNITDFHEWLRPYRHLVHLSITNLHKGWNARFSVNDKRPAFSAELRVWNTAMLLINYSPMHDLYNTSPKEPINLNIQAIGGDGRKRNCTLLLVPLL